MLYQTSHFIFFFINFIYTNNIFFTAKIRAIKFKICENHRMVKNDDGTVDSSAHPWFKPNQKKHRKHKISEREKHDKNATAKRSEQHQRSESTNG